jgi:predicted nucleic acid-binding protein
MERPLVRVPAALRGCRDVVLDTMCLIYLFEDDPAFGALCEHVMQLAADRVFSAVITPVTAAEVLVKPLRERRGDLADRYRLALENLPNVRLATLTPHAGWMAGALRAKYGLPLPDMLQVAVALQSRKPGLITNDAGLKRVEELPVCLLSDFR